MKQILSLLLIFSVFSVFCQNKTLVIRHKSYFKREQFYIGDPIKFYLKQDKLPLTGTITQISDSAIHFHYATVLNDNEGYTRIEHDASALLRDISVISIKDKKRKFGIGVREISAYLGGFGLLMVGQSFYTWIRDGEPNTPYMLTGAGIFSLAQVPLLLKRKKYVIGKKWALEVINY